ncbi:MAG: 16S rRNA (uracil(1498)-N(3))-methyltransferase [Spirochaetia bacterium]|nr:16S rRNA (uracil(1498)-N(3))-methyltransferase [Spirochaetia bacterium]
MTFLVFRKECDFKEEIPLSAAEIRHVRARRLRKADEVLVGDGRELHYQAGFSSDMKKLVILDDPPRKRKEPFRIACTSLPSGNRLDWMLQKSAELGVTHILPILCSRSGRVKFSSERAERIIHEAAVQSERFFLPEVYEPVKLKDSFSFIENNITDQALHTFLYTGSAPSFTEVQCEKPVSFFIGPEGDFDEQEISFFNEMQVRPYSLGNTILKVETAVLAALAVLSAKSI